MNPTPSVRELVEYGLEKVDENQVVEVPLRDLLYVHRVLEELNRFFHNRAHYPEVSDVEEFLGDVTSGGGYEVLHTALYKKLRSLLPEEISEQMSLGAFQHPVFPSYYAE